MRNESYRGLMAISEEISIPIGGENGCLERVSRNLTKKIISSAGDKLIQETCQLLCFSSSCLKLVIIGN